MSDERKGAWIAAILFMGDTEMTRLQEFQRHPLIMRRIAAYLAVMLVFLCSIFSNVLLGILNLGFMAKAKSFLPMMIWPSREPGVAHSLDGRKSEDD